jgi:hypothetical protein
MHSDRYNEDDREFTLAPGEKERIEAALDKLEEDNHAPRELSVRVVLNVFKEYPKAVEGRTVNSRREEQALRAKLAAEKAADEPNALQLGAEVRRLGLSGDKPQASQASQQTPAGSLNAAGSNLQTMEIKLPEASQASDVTGAALTEQGADPSKASE